jgi:hypothetical protein
MKVLMLCNANAQMQAKHLGCYNPCHPDHRLLWEVVVCHLGLIPWSDVLPHRGQPRLQREDAAEQEHSEHRLASQPSVL